MLTLVVLWMVFFLAKISLFDFISMPVSQAYLFICLLTTYFIYSLIKKVLIWNELLYVWDIVLNTYKVLDKNVFIWKVELWYG